MKNLIAIITFSLLIIGCSKKEAGTPTNIRITLGAIAGPNAPAAFSGGLVLVIDGITDSGQSQKRLKVLSSESHSEVLPNGSWNFYAVGWDGPDHLAGKPYCGSLKAQVIDGTKDLDGALSVSNAECASTDFTDETNLNSNNISGVSFPKLEIETCKSLDSISGSSNFCRYNLSANQDLNNQATSKGHARSYQIILKDFSTINGVIPKPTLKNRADLVKIANVGLLSQCMRVSENSEYANIDPVNSSVTPNLPQKIGSMDMRAILVAYPDKMDCAQGISDEGRHIAKLINLNPNRSQIEPGIKVYSRSSTIATTEIFNKISAEDICTDINRYNRNFFPAGNGSQYSPFVICSAKQLNLISHTHIDKHFVLGSDINMNSETAAFAMISATVPPAPCTDAGENLMPIGGYTMAEVQLLEADSSGICGSYTGQAQIGAFTGTLNGNNHLVNHLRTGNRELSQQGFIRRMSSGSVLANIRFENLEIQGASILGIAAKTDGATPPILKNISVMKSRIYAEPKSGTSSQIGVLAGYAQVATISNIFIEHSNIRAKNTNSAIGGIIGEFEAGSISKVLFSGAINARSDYGISNATSYGGIVGLMSGGTLTEATSSGILKADGDTVNVGGLVGNLNGSLSNSYSSMLINIDNQSTTAMYAGGLVGTNTASAIENTYYQGKLYTDCGQDPCLAYHDIQADGSTSQNSYSTPPAVAALNTGAPNPWVDHGGGVPQLNFEQIKRKYCAKTDNYQPLSIQSSVQNKGSEVNPIVICTSAQFQELNALASSTNHYILGQNMRLDINPTNGVFNIINSSFNGKLDGNNKIIYDTTITGTLTSGDTPGIFKEVGTQGIIKDLTLYFANYSLDTSSPAGTYSGGLVALNKGHIKNVSVSAVFHNSISPTSVSNVGGIVGINDGTIESSHSNAHIFALNNVGGIAYQNKGNISKSNSSTEMYLDNLYGYIGGVVAHNDTNGIVDQVLFSGRLINEIPSGNSNTSPTSMTAVGGIASTNDGTISNVMTSEHSLLKLNGGAGMATIGGIVGMNNKEIKYSLHAGDIEISDAGSNSIMRPITGDTALSGSSIIKSFYSKAPLAIVHGQYSTDFSTPSFTSNTITIPAPTANFSSLSISNIKKMMLEGASHHYFNVTSALMPASDLTLTVDGDPSGISGVSTIDLFQELIFSPYSGVNKFSETVGSTNSPELFETYCNDPSASDPNDPDNYVCTDGWNIATDDVGFFRILDAHLAQLSGDITSIASPIWETEGGNSLPRLFAVDSSN